MNSIEERLVADGYGGADPILFYSKIHAFHEFSNFSRHGLRMIDHWTGTEEHYQTGEHRYQAMKAASSQEHTWVRQASGPGQAKERGRQVELRDQWGSSYGDLCWYVMFETVAAKAMQHPNIRRLLLSTGDRPIYEDSPTDDIWGVRFAQSYTGKNLLGRCWMDVRSALR